MSLILAAAVIARPAGAAEFLLNYDLVGGSNQPVTATLTTTDTTTDVAGRQAYSILGISGTRGAGNILGFFISGTTFGTHAVDNYLFMDGGPHFSQGGFGFFTDDALYEDFIVNHGNNIFYPDGYDEDERAADPSIYYLFLGSNRIELTVEPGRLTSPGVPEPATWAMLILGFGLTGAALRRRSAPSRTVRMASLPRV